MIRILLAAMAIAAGLCAAVLADEVAPLFSAQLIYEPGGVDFPSCHGSTLAELPNGDIIAAWYGGAFEKAKDVAIYASVQKKGETAWAKPRVIHDTPGKSEGNPVLWVDAKGTLHLFYVTIMKENWNDAQMFRKESLDGGVTWSEQEEMTKTLSWMTRNKPLVLKDGTVLLPIYNEMLFNSVFLVSEDGGAKWKKTETLRAPGGNIQPSAVQLADGSVLTCMRTGSKNGLLWWARSTDGGRKWGDSYTTEVKNPGAAADMVMLKSGAIALVFNDSATARNPLSVALSDDGGKTWPFVRVLDYDETGKMSYHYPAVIQASDGTIRTTYTYDRISIKQAAFNEEWVRQGEGEMKE